jgi:predicted nucleic acid-binding protein
MTAIVIDASALAAYLLHEKGSETVGRYLVEGVDSIELVFKEAASAILTAERTGRIDRDQAEVCLEALRTIMGLNVRAAGQGDLLEESCEVARKHDTTVYDAMYVVLAKRLRVKLLTKDEKQAQVAREEGLGIVT